VEDILSLKNSFLKESKSAASVAELQQLRVKYLGKKGLVTSKLKALSTISPELRPAYGKAVNEVKVYIEEEINRIEAFLKKEEHKKRIVSEAVDITLPGKFTPFGREHPINKVLYEITNIFVSMGFEVEEGPDSGRVFSRLRNRALKWISDVFSVPEKDAEYARIRDGCA